MLVMFACTISSCSSASNANNSTAQTDTSRRATQKQSPETALLMSRLSALSADSMEGRRAGTPGSERARRWIIRQLSATGVKPGLASSANSGALPVFEQKFQMPVRAGADSIGTNIVGFIKGRQNSGPAIVVSAHYDHLGVRNGEIYNGADDDASGSVALITIAEGLIANQPEHDVYLIFFDAEESGTLGSKAFVASGAVPLDRVAFDLSLDMISRQDGKALWVAGTSHYPFLKAIVEPVAQKASIAIRFGHDTRGLPPGDDWTGSSDHKAFHEKGIPFLYLGVEDHADYHKPGDDADKVDPQFYSSAVAFAHDVLRAIDKSIQTFPKRM